MPVFLLAGVHHCDHHLQGTGGVSMVETGSELQCLEQGHITGKGLTHCFFQICKTIPFSSTFFFFYQTNIGFKNKPFPKYPTTIPWIGEGETSFIIHVNKNRSELTGVGDLVLCSCW